MLVCVDGCTCPCVHWGRTEIGFRNLPSLTTSVFEVGTLRETIAPWIGHPGSPRNPPISTLSCGFTGAQCSLLLGCKGREHGDSHFYSMHFHHRALSSLLWAVLCCKRQVNYRLGNVQSLLGELRQEKEGKQHSPTRTPNG